MRHRNRIQLAVACACTISVAQAQTAAPQLGNPWWRNESAMSVPSMQGRGFEHFSITIPSVEAWADNTAIPFGPLREALLKDHYTEELLNSIVNNGSDRFYLGFGLQAQVLGFGMNIGKKGEKPLFSLGVEHRERTLFGSNIDQELVSLLYEGNKQYAGENLVLDPLSIRTMSYRELGVNAAMDIALGGTEEHTRTLRPGIGVYRLIGIQGTYMNDATVEMFTHSDGRAVDLRSNYDLDTALPTEGGQLFNGTGQGMAIDLSASLRFDDHLEVYAGVDDLGSIKFKEGTTNYSANGAYTYRGVQYTFIDQEFESSVTLDSLIQIGKPTITEEAWRMPLPTQLIIGGTYGSHRTDYDAMALFRHTWGFCVTHELSRPVFNFSPTMISGSYSYAVASVASLGATMATNGRRAPRLGFNLSLRGGPVRLWIGSSNLTPFLLRKEGSGGNATVALQFAW